MMTVKEKDLERSRSDANGRLEKKLDAVGWGLFFIWLGIVLLTELETAVAVMGVGVVILGKQATRKYYGLQAERFWTLVALLFVAGGVWNLMDMRKPFGPIVLITIGFFIMAKIVFERKPSGPEPAVDEPAGEPAESDAGREDQGVTR